MILPLQGSFYFGTGNIDSVFKNSSITNTFTHYCLNVSVLQPQYNGPCNTIGPNYAHWGKKQNSCSICTERVSYVSKS